MTIRLNLKRTDGHTSSVLIIVRYNNVKYVIASKVSVQVDDWDKKRERCKTDDFANRKLEVAQKWVKSEIERTGQVPRRIEVERKGKEKIVDVIRQYQDGLIAQGAITFSWKCYNTLTGLIKRFTTEKGRRETLTSDITPEYVEQFVVWMFAQHYSNGHTAKMVRLLKTATKTKVPETWNKVKLPKSTPADMIYLVPDEIELLEKMQFGKGDEKLERCRDLFLYGLYTGQRYSDWRKIDQTRVQVLQNVSIVSLVQQKTGGRATIPIGEKLGRLMEKYKVSGVPVLSNQKFNKSVKELCKAAGIAQKVSITQYLGGKAVNVTVEKWKLVSSHTARRSFATNAMTAGIPVSEIMKFTGHKSISAFLQYIRTTGQDAAINFANHPFFK